VRDIGVRLARQKLLRYRPPEPAGKRWWRLVWLGVAVWAVYALFLSDHSIRRVLSLRSERDRLAVELERSEQDLRQAEKRTPDAKPTPEQAERLLRDRHGYAREGEWVYVIGEDSTGRLPTAPSKGKSRRAP
jgi:hypothetical protein